VKKILCRNIFDRRPILSRIADKAAARSYVAERLGPSVLTDLYCLTDTPETIAFDDLPDRFVVKPTHGSGWIRLVKDKAHLDRAELIATCRDWLSRSYSREAFESIYRNIRPQIMIEQYVDDGTGSRPTDYKLFVFHGHVHLIEVHIGRCEDHRTGLYIREWEPIPVKGFVTRRGSSEPNPYKPLEQDLERPAHLTEMIEAAECLGKDWDFIRADLYDTPQKVYFGEITLMPAAGRERFEPEEHDSYLGSLWRPVAGNRYSWQLPKRLTCTVSKTA